MSNCLENASINFIFIQTFQLNNTLYSLSEDMKGLVLKWLFFFFLICHNILRLNTEKREYAQI